MRGVLEQLEGQQIATAAELVANTLRSGGLIPMFGSEDSLLLAIEVFFRAGGLVAVNPILDLRLQFNSGVIESTEFERTSGAAQEHVHAKILGGVWFVLGIAYDAVKTDGFRENPAMYDLSSF